MAGAYQDVRSETRGLNLQVRFTLANRGNRTWRAGSYAVGWQFFDPDSNRFIAEGEWTALSADVPPGGRAPIELTIPFPPEGGAYRVYISGIENPGSWAYLRGDPFVLIDAEVAEGQVRAREARIVTLRGLRWESWRRAIPKLFTEPLLNIARNRRLIRSMARRDILARYRGSFGDIFWTILHPLLLMGTYFFVFGVVLRTRFGADHSSTGFALYFLAGMLPWLAFSEPVGRAPHVILEHRNFVKKLIFPLETLPVNQVVAGLATEVFATAVFLTLLLLIRHVVPITVFWLPALLVPQLLFTLGLCWLLAAMGVFFRDLGQIMGFLLTLWFFITPICYPEASLPASAMVFLGKNPMYVLVRAYRAILLEGQAPQALALIKLWLVAIATFLFGYACFYKLRKSFADVI
jgi:lipopolysaccharide transport system permease protein